MRFRSSFLFYALAAISLILIPLTNHLSLDLNVHDTYFILTYFHYLAAICILSLCTGFIYSLMDLLKKPVTVKMAFTHFVLIVIGLVFSLNFYGFIVMCVLTGPVDTAAFSFDQHLLISFLSGPIVLISGAFVFMYGIISALTRKTSNS